MKRLILVTIAVLALTVSKAQSKEDQPEFRKAAEKITALLFHLENSYVDSVELEKVVDGVIREVLGELDPHSVYIPADDVKRANEGLEGNFEGIGIQFNILRDTITVVSPISGGPSESLGIMAGDKIVSIDGENVAGTGVTNSDVTSSLRGTKGTEVTVGIRRRENSKVLIFDIVRDEIPLYSLDASYMATDKIGYIKINRFSKTTMDEFHAAIKSLKEQGMQDLVLDLQGNGGGLLETSRQLADEFISTNKMIVYTEGRSYPKREMVSTSKGEFEEGRLIVLTNEGSASASEIVSGAIQDWDRGLIVGRRTFGKGLVQRPIALPDGSYIRLTTQKYFTPSGRCIQKPYDDGMDAYYREKFDRYESGEFWSLDSLDFPDSLKYSTENGRVVYGGGGILPDVFVPLDTTASSDLNSDLIRKGVMNSFAITYTNKQRKKLLKEFGDVGAYVDGFDIDMAVTELKEYAAREDEEIDWSEEEFNTSRKMIEGRLKALIARNLWDYSAYYQVFNPYWGTYIKAIEILKENDYNEFKLADSRL
ncbi:MAG: carboxyl-terminal processing protease [Flammeovirgaceae bacterium]|jgi:carboxyl-terminal processing protease